MSNDNAGPTPKKPTILDVVGDRERHLDRISRLIEARGADDDDYAGRFLRAMIDQATANDRPATVKLAADIDAWRRARRAYRCFFV